jgi:hypothetical protein
MWSAPPHQLIAASHFAVNAVAIARQLEIRRSFAMRNAYTAVRHFAHFGRPSDYSPPQQKARYSITSSAVAMSICGMDRRTTACRDALKIGALSLMASGLPFGRCGKLLQAVASYSKKNMLKFG